MGLLVTSVLKNTANLLIRGLQRLEYRGYDSSSIAVHTPEGFYLSKEVGRAQELEKIVDLSHTKGAGIAFYPLGDSRWCDSRECSPTPVTL